MIEEKIILSLITESLIVVNVAGEILFYNAIAESYRDLIAGPIAIGENIYELLDPENREVTRFAIDDVFRTGEVHSAETVHRHPAGHSVFFETNYNPIFDKERSVEFVCVVSRDITPQKTFEKKTLQLIRELSSLIETANAIIFGVDVEGYVTEWNNECTRISGYAKEEMLGKKIDLIIERAEGNGVVQLLGPLFAGNLVTNRELRMVRRNSETAIVLLNGTPKTNAAGQIIGALFVGQDVTELMEYRITLENEVRDRTVKLREALNKERELVELKNKFVSIASHEFKIPLNAITTSVNSLKKNMESSQVSYLNKITEHVGYMKSLLDDVLSIERNETVRINPKISPVDLLGFLTKVIKEVSDATSHTHEFITYFPAQEIVIPSDEKLLRNVFVNLLSNAVKFSPGKDRVVVRVIPGPEVVNVSVQDFGIGIAEEDLDKVFVAFTRGSNATSISGTGLGLSIVKKAVESLSGKLRVSSVLGAGSIFKVELPDR
jgi:PAS domain S-box-containing protein